MTVYQRMRRMNKFMNKHGGRVYRQRFVMFL
jgi:hypothetical protein